VVATFCHNIAHDLPIKINDPSAQLRLVYVDDVVSEFLRVLESMSDGVRRGAVAPVYSISLGDLAAQIESFRNCRSTLVSERVGTGFARALYATYVSYLPPSSFAYDLPRRSDERGISVDVLKTPDCGQFSYFTVHPGETRGGRYHHSKTEKAVVIRGSARFGFRHIVTNETYEVLASGEAPKVVEMVPGWAHDITNVGEDEMIVMLWASENCDHGRNDGIRCKI
jgi:UDP-2-acetamido-2,6-beta-L-arabino-hexul-4-ose reductase